MQVGDFNKSAPLPTNKNPKATNVQPHQMIFNEAFSVQYSGKTWEATPLKDRQVKQSSGVSTQFLINIQNGNETYTLRVKQVKTLSEALVYHRIRNSNDPLGPFVPNYIGALDREGKQIDLDALLKDRSITELCHDKSLQPIYLMMEDLVENLSEHEKLDLQSKIRDFKFTRASGHHNFIAKFHDNRIHGFLYKMFTKAYMTQSGSSFAFQKTTKFHWYTAVICYCKRLMSIKTTRSKLQQQFERLPDEQLKAIKIQLTEMREAMQHSDFSCSDASLLFVPVVRTEGGRTYNDVRINLIDLNHGMAKEDVAGNDRHLKVHNHLKFEMVDSIRELESMIDKILITTRIIHPTKDHGMDVN